MQTIADRDAVTAALAPLEFSDAIPTANPLIVEYQHPSYRLEIAHQVMPWGVQVLVTTAADILRGSGWRVELLGETPISVLEAVVKEALA